MHHQDFSGDPPGTGTRKSTYHYRRGSSGASASSAAVSASVTADESTAQAGSSSPALHHQSQVPGAQVKKKSGFQITSVTSAQINVSGNNSLADDTESYDDMDESHTEDLSSSDILDVSASRATDTGVPGRSSSDETLNSLHGVDTPGLVSPNEHLQAHIPQVSQTHSSLVNGTIHPQFYPQPHHHHSDSLGGSEPTLPPLPIAPLASSSPTTVSKIGTSQFQRPPMLDNTKPLVGSQPSVGNSASDTHLQSSVNISVSTAFVVPLSGSTGFDTNVGGETGASAATNTQSQHTQTQTGSRFRVVKLDTNSEPFRKGRWTCTEYYEKEVPHTAPSEAPKGLEVCAETEAAVSPAAQAAHTLQSYQPPNQDFTSPPAMQSPPQGVAQTTPLSHVPTQESNMGLLMQKTLVPVPVGQQAGVSQPSNIMTQQMPQAPYPPQIHSGVLTQATVRPPDFIQPTAPFQTQVQPPLPHIPTGMPITPSPALPSQPHVNIPQLIAQGQVAPPVQATFPTSQLPNLPAQPQPQLHLQVQPSPIPVPVAPSQGAQAMPLTALQADLQPLLAPTENISQIPAPGKSSQLEDAHRLLLQHQSLLGLPRFGVPATGGESSVEVGTAGAALAHMGMSAETSAFMAAAAAAGLRSQHADGEDDSSSGASVVAIDNKIEQAMDLVKSHLMYAVREEVEVLKEQIKELIERNSQLEQENNLLKNLASPEQMAQFQAQVNTGGSPNGTGQPPISAGTQQALPSAQNTNPSA